MNTIPEVENVAGSIFEEINNNNNTSNQHLIASLKTAIVEKPHLSLINNQLQPNFSPKTRASTKELANKGNNNFIAANDFFGIPKKMLRRNSKYTNSMTSIQNRTTKKVNFKMPFACIVEVESFKQENFECMVETYKRKRRSSTSSKVKSCCKKLKCIIL